MQSALLWYQTFKGCLEGLGFELNPYGPCVANMDINGSQCTVCCYVDDNKISHTSSTVVDKVIEEIEKKFGKMTVKRGKTHIFVGMNIEFLDDKKVAIGMKVYVEEAIDTFGEEVTGVAKTPAKGDLFELDTDEMTVRLEEEKVNRFHHIVAKLLYVSKRARIDIDLTISFLCTRVVELTQDDWVKLYRVLQYLNSTMNMRRIMGASSLEFL